MPKRMLPEPTPETREFWEGAQRSELRIQRCRSCGKAYFYPRPFCPHCASRDVAVARSLNPRLRTFGQWLAVNKDRIPVG